MKIHLKHLHQQPSASFNEHLEQQLQPLGEIRQIDEVHVVLEHRTEASPAYRVALHLVTPGPDFTAEAIDHTLRAALTKAVEELHHKIADRQANRARRVRSNLQEPAALQPGAKHPGRR